MSGPPVDEGSSAPGADGPGGGGPPGDDAVGGPDDEVLEVLDIHDEMSAMADPDPVADGSDAAADRLSADPLSADPLSADPLSTDPLAGDPLAVELAETRQQRDDFLDALRRLQADFENYKKRVAKQQADTAARAAETIVERLLPALDTADLAMAHGGGEEVKQVWSALIDALSGEGLERIAPDGGPFDPNRHDAVAHEPGDGDQEVAEVLRAGYAWKGRVLRPAMVKVRG